MYVSRAHLLPDGCVALMFDHCLMGRSDPALKGAIKL
jgi:hypothetical protein